MITGGCQCGEVRYEVRGEAIGLYVCHCRECQKQSASAFGISFGVRGRDIVVLSGEPKQWSRAATVQGRLDCAFCPTCGTRLWHGDRQSDDWVSIKGGSLDSPPDLTGAKHIWVKRKLPGVVIPKGAETWPEEPDT